METVWVLMERDKHEGGTCRGIFTTEELANKAMGELESKTEEWDSVKYRVTEVYTDQVLGYFDL